ncbi:TraI/MobA(P) family conjugative relaxase [Providencia sp. PROV033]|uniref:TraI/MobA(P) family conjugative relaxase n=1 Tax=Providencia sp. PROV033 TaxID=2949765 RepID=UPI002349CD99|nr:TraI/MobA(P) family conjugative relaxase [Providencia sp. PROV033]
MIAEVPPKRRDGRSSFVKLVSYITLRDDVEMSETLSPDKPFVRQSRAEAKIFNDLVDYATRNPLPESVDVMATYPDGRQHLRCGDVIVETNCFSLATAATEMNMVALQNRHCKDPVYHVILSWPESERPTPEHIFDCAQHSMKNLGMEGHQYVCAIHDDTDNLHCHLSVNRINPVSYRAASLYNDRFILDRCCREMELKYGWQHVNGPYMVNSHGRVVRKKAFYKSAPAAARELEHFGDKESLFSYAVDHCRERMNTLLFSGDYSWSDVHDILISAGLELRKKGDGLAIYDLTDDKQTPIKASDLHPELTLHAQSEWIGEFTRGTVYRHVNHDGHYVLRSAVEIHSEYDSTLHRRDKEARLERREARAEARQKLIARYKSYKTCFVRPTISAEVVRARFREVAAGYRIRKNHVRLTERDPLLRKLMFRALEVEKMKDMAALRLVIRDERQALNARLDSRPLSYRAWVEMQAMAHDTAAISQLRGWAYREKRKNRTARISNNLILYAAADDIKPAQIRGYESHVNRDGAVVYTSGGKPVLLDRGIQFEIADAPEEKGKNQVMALQISGYKSGERMEVRGSREFVASMMKGIPIFNASAGKTVPLTHPVQRKMAGYHDQPRQAAEPPTPKQKTASPHYTPFKPR